MVFWDTTPLCMVGKYGCFRWRCCLHIQVNLVSWRWWQHFHVKRWHQVTKPLTTMSHKTVNLLILLYLHFKDNSSESSKIVFITSNKTTLFYAFFACFVSETTKQIWMKVCTKGTQAFDPMSVKFSPTLGNAQTEIIEFLQTADSATNSYIT